MSKILSSITVFVLLLSSSLCVFGQDVYQSGFVVLNDGTKIPGQIMLNSKEPWINQRHVYMKDSIEISKVGLSKADSKKYRFDDLKSYQVGERVFDKVHYVNLGNLQVKSLGANDHMLERLASGKITGYRYYEYLDDMYAGSKESVDKKVQQDKEESVKLWKFLVKKESEDKFRDAFQINLEKYFEDTPVVLERYNKGAYGNRPVSTKKGLAAKMTNLAWKSNELMHVQGDAIVAAIRHYNSENLKK